MFFTRKVQTLIVGKFPWNVYHRSPFPTQISLRTDSQAMLSHFLSEMTVF